MPKNNQPDPVFILLTITPYEGTEIEGVFTTKTLAEQAAPDVKRWYGSSNINSETVSTSRGRRHTGFGPWNEVRCYQPQGGK